MKSLHRYTSSLWWHFHWRKILLLSIVVVGVFSMAIFKVSTKSGSWSFVALVFFTEISAGVAVFAQALLRRVNAKAANQAFVFSKYARAAMALIGVALFAEACSYVTTDVDLYTSTGQEVVVAGAWIFPYLKTGAISWTAFLTYEVGNGLMLLIEWMFSHLLEHEDYDARQQLEAQAIKLEEAEAQLEQVVTQHQNLEAHLTGLEHVHQEAAGILETAGLCLQDPGTALDVAVRELVGRYQDSVVGVEQAAEKIDLASRLLDGATSYQEVPPDTGGHLVQLAVSMVKENQRLVKSAKSLESLVDKMAGQPFTVRKNVQAFYCQACHKRTEKSHKSPNVCSHCGHHQKK